jgi:hypothetical protein
VMTRVRCQRALVGRWVLLVDAWGRLDLVEILAVVVVE